MKQFINSQIHKDDDNEDDNVHLIDKTGDIWTDKKKLNLVRRQM